MKLAPVRPPGHGARKARAYEADIRLLRAQGYTFEAIREALAGAGVHVSNSTVQREAARARQQPPAATTAAANSETKGSSMPSPLASAKPVAATGVSVGSPTPPHWQKGKDVAEAYTAGLMTNPFLRAKEKR